MIDYAMIISKVNRQIRESTNEIIIREQQSIKEQPDYPFATYSIMNPYLNVKTYREDEGKMTQSVEITVSYTFYSQDALSLMGIVQNALTNFEHRATRQVLWDNGIAVIDVTGIQNRDTFLTIDVERRLGFDIRLRVNNISEKELRDIITIELEDGSEIHK